MTRLVYEPEPEFIGVDVADGTLLALALLSDDAAERMLAYRPTLKPMVRTIRASPEEARASLARQEPPVITTEGWLGYLTPPLVKSRTTHYPAVNLPSNRGRTPVLSQSVPQEPP